METATQAQVDELCKKVTDITELVKTSKTENETQVKQMIEEVLKNHPGFTPPQRVQFPDNAPTRADDILDSMPKEIQQKADDIFLTSKILKVKPQELKMWGGFLRQAGDYKKALDTATAGGGLEWIPTDFSTNLYELIRLEQKVMALFPTIAMPSNPYKLPIQVGRLMTFRHDEQTADTSQTLIPKADAASLTGNRILTAVGHATMVLTSKDLEEDSIIPILPFLRSEIITALAEGREDCTLNGDTAATKEDSDTETDEATSRRTMWLGLRAIAHDDSNAFDLSELTISNIRQNVRAPMGKYGVVPSQLAWITGVKGYMKLLDMAEVTTVDKYGAGATILSGELAKLDGIPIIVSEFVREDLDASGLYAVGGTKTVLHLVNRKGFVLGTRRAETSIQLLVEKFADSDQDALKIRERVIWSPIYLTSANKTAFLGQNVG